MIEKICKNCKHHYIEEISFDYPQSCCSKREATTEEWCKCNDFEYSNRYIEQLQQENKQLKTDMKVLFNENSNKEKVIIKQNDNWNKLKEHLNYKSERAVGEDEYVYDEIYNEMQELEQGSDE